MSSVSGSKKSFERAFARVRAGADYPVLGDSPALGPRAETAVAIHAKGRTQMLV
jgi:hypothetical protein